MECIDIVLADIRYHKQSKFGKGGGIPFLIATAASGVSIKGEMRSPVRGERYRLWGEMRPQKKGYPDAFEFSSYEVLCDKSSHGIESYLVRHCKGIGTVKAKALIDRFGTDVLDVLRSDPSQALEIDGFTPELVESIRVHFSETRNLDPAAYAKLVDMTADFRIPRKVIEACLKAWGSSAPEVIQDNPYLLLNFPRVGWKTADALALALGYPEAGLERHCAAIAEAMSRISEDGNTVATLSEIRSVCEPLVGSELLPDAMPESIRQGHIVELNDGWWDEHKVGYQLAALAYAEATIAERLDMLRRNGPQPIDGLITGRWTAQHDLGQDQVVAARLIAREPVCIVTGAPGVGKSYLISKMIGLFIKNGHTAIRVVAPTGKAAKRVRELLLDVPGAQGIPCTTIHRALGMGISTDSEGVPKDSAKFGRAREAFEFQKHSGNPIEEKIVVIDEASMIDTKLASSLLQALANGTRVIFVGDHNQLPSVGPGSVLRDMISADIPTAILSEIRRSDTCGTVVKACHAIISDRIPCHADRIDLPTENWVHVELSDPSEIADRIVEINSSIKTFDRLWDVQIISPQKAKLLFGCDRLNYLLSKVLNPKACNATPLRDQATGEIIEDSNGDPGVGDKVCRTRNALVDELVEITGEGRQDFFWSDRRWKARPVDVVNGDMGTVLDITDDSVIVEFRDPTRLCRLPIDEPFIIKAYALTCHKMQGSGAQCVIVPFHHSFYWDERSGKGLWNRELAYTMISRTEKLLISVGQWSAFLAAIRRKTVNRRRTTLVQRIKSIDGGGENGEPEGFDF